MKKQISFCLALALAFSLVACGDGSSSASSPNNNSSDTADAGNSSSDAAEPAADDVVLRDMSADIANPNLAGKYTANIGGPVTEQGDWIYYISGRATYRVRKDTMDFDAAELLYQADHGIVEELNISGKYLYFNIANTNGTGASICQLDLETDETSILCSGEVCYSSFYYDGYLYISGRQASLGGAPETYYIRRMAVPATQDGVTAEQLYSDTRKYHMPYILDVDEQGIYARIDEEGIVLVTVDSVQTLLDHHLDDAIMANGILYVKNVETVFTLAADGSTSTVYSGDWRDRLSMGADAGGRLILSNESSIFYADTMEPIARRSIHTIYTTSNGGIFFEARDGDNGFYYMDSQGENFRVLG